MIIGISVDDLLEQQICRVPSELPEIGIKNNLSLEKIKTICVPSDKIEFVKKMVNIDEISVLPMDDIREKFYYIQDDYGDIEISYEDVNKLKSELFERKKTKVFGNDELKNMTCGRFLKSIKKQLVDFNFIVNSAKEVEYDGRKIK